MSNEMTFNDVLESVDKLSLDEQETLTEVLRRRLIEHRREELAREIKDAGGEFQDGSSKPATSSEIMKEILA